MQLLHCSPRKKTLPSAPPKFENEWLHPCSVPVATTYRTLCIDQSDWYYTFLILQCQKSVILKGYLQSLPHTCTNSTKIRGHLQYHSALITGTLYELHFVTYIIGIGLQKLLSGVPIIHVIKPGRGNHSRYYQLPAIARNYLSYFITPICSIIHETLHVSNPRRYSSFSHSCKTWQALLSISTREMDIQVYSSNRKRETRIAYIHAWWKDMFYWCS